MKVKVHTGVEQKSYDKILQIAIVQYDGNFSMALRKVIESGLSLYGTDKIVIDIKSPHFTKEQINKIVQDNCNHNFDRFKGDIKTCVICGKQEFIWAHLKQSSHFVPMIVKEEKAGRTTKPCGMLRDGLGCIMPNRLK